MDEAVAAGAATIGRMIGIGDVVEVAATKTVIRVAQVSTQTCTTTPLRGR